MSTSRDYPAEPPRAAARVVLLGSTCAAALGRAALHRRLAFVHVYHLAAVADARAARRRARGGARGGGCARVVGQASLAPAADALRLRNWTLDLLNVRALPADAST